MDELRFVVEPIVAGKGRCLIEDVNLPARLVLKFVESKIFKSGCVALCYSNQVTEKSALQFSFLGRTYLRRGPSAEQ